MMLTEPNEFCRSSVMPLRLMISFKSSFKFERNNDFLIIEICASVSISKSKFRSEDGLETEMKSESSLFIDKMVLAFTAVCFEPGHIPFPDSKLTARRLATGLGGFPELP